MLQLRNDVFTLQHTGTRVESANLHFKVTFGSYATDILLMMMMTLRILLASLERVHQAMYMTNLQTGLEINSGFRLAYITCSSYFLPAPLYP